MTEEEKQNPEDLQETGNDIQPNQTAETPEGHEADDPEAERYPGAPRPGMIPNQAPEGQAPAINVTPASGGATSAEAADSSATGAGPSGGGEPESAAPPPPPAPSNP
jgi:hypothetical protein